ncbi:MAG: tRNA pseudouridine(55) synthase TruB [Rickettsiales bacterium]|jgi:tRNA pseudouridine55 synthase|nr:tRNA pseudouridine(55) synthase TruB [Rickettsiales bacterium]
MLNGFINIGKLPGMTSNDVVARLKRILFPRFGKFKIGHAGTLDPMAEGVLPVALGEATKALPYLSDTRKTYVFDIRFGRATSTDDADGETVAETDSIPEPGEIERLLPRFTGRIMQTPPKFSAVKIGGRRAYELARANVEFEMKPRENFVHRLGILEIPAPGSMRLEVEAERGFYVRSLARDIALAAGSLGHAGLIRRTASGAFALENSITLDKLASMLDNWPQSLDVRNCICDFLLPIAIGLNGISVLCIGAEQNGRLRRGMKIPLPGLEASRLYQVHCENSISAIAESADGESLRPIRIFNL